jgi:Rad3-related DNA helicase
MYIESFEEILRKILRYRNITYYGSDSKFRMDDKNFQYDYNDFIAILYEDVIEDYTKTKKMKGKLSLKRVKTLGFWCFNAGNSFRQIMSLKPRSVILTSGTLTPMDSFEKEL